MLLPTAVSCFDIDAAKALGLLQSLLSLDSASNSLCMTRCGCSGGNPVCCCRPVRGQARRSGYPTGTSAAAAAIVSEIRLVWPVAGDCLCIERLRKKSLRVPDPETQLVEASGARDRLYRQAYCPEPTLLRTLAEIEATKPGARRPGQRGQKPRLASIRSSLERLELPSITPEITPFFNRTDKLGCSPSWWLLLCSAAIVGQRTLLPSIGMPSSVHFRHARRSR